MSVKDLVLGTCNCGYCLVLEADFATFRGMW
jgi:hypothetical protein